MKTEIVIPMLERFVVQNQLSVMCLTHIREAARLMNVYVFLSFLKSAEVGLHFSSLSHLVLRPAWKRETILNHCRRGLN